MTHHRTSLATFLIGALIVATATLHASDVAGKVVLSGRPGADVIVSIEGLTLAQPPDVTVHVIDHHNLDFVPHVLVIRPGTKVRFENSDGMPCHIYSISPAGAFALRGNNGEPMTMTFDQPGVIVIRCADHSRIYAYIIVRENPFYAITDRRGRYKLSGISPGRYTVQAWYEGTVIESRRIEVAGRRAKADFVADRPQPQAQNGVFTPAVAASAEHDATTPNVSWRKEQ